MFFGDNRNEIRDHYLRAWRKLRDGLPMEPLEAQIADVVQMHPEYHGLLESGELALDRDWLPEGGQSNPFLHLGLHIALREQLATDRPAGIRDLARGFLRGRGDGHEAEHEMIECLAASLWQAQRDNRPPEESAYLDCLRERLRRLGGGRRRGC